MALRLGRAGLDIPLREPRSWSQSGPEVALEGLLTDVTSWELRLQREQLLGLGHADEPVILVRSDSVPELDGFYIVDKVDVASPPGSFVYLALPWSAQLRRIGNWQQPLIEDYFLAWAVPHGWGSGMPALQAFHYMPHTAQTHADAGLVNVFNPYGGVANVRPSADGDMTYVTSDMTAQGLTNINTSLLWTVPLADYYRGDCRIEFDSLNDGTSWRRIIGRQLLNKPLQVRLSNGVVRLALGAGTFTATWWDGAAWVSSKTWRFTVGGGTTSTVSAWAQVGILRNTPEECSIRLVADPASNVFRQLAADVTIKRGSRWVFVRTFTLSGGNHTWTMEGSVNEAATALKPGIHRTANDGSGNRWLLASNFGTTTDLANGKLTSASLQQVLYAFGLELGGTGAVAPNTASAQFGEWYTGTQVAMRPVGM